MNKTIKIWIRAAFALYILALIYILFFKGRINPYTGSMPLSEYIKHSVNLVPFETIKGFLNALKNNRIHTDIVIFNIFGNILLFVPFGFFLPAAQRRLRALWKCLAVSFFVILAAEILQLVLMLGSLDIDDLILNILGVIIGYAVYKIAFAAYKATGNMRKNGAM